MALKKTITDEEFIEIGAGIANEMTSSPMEYVKFGLVFAAVAAELFGESTEKSEKNSKVENLFEKDIDDVRYIILTGGVTYKDDFVLIKSTLPAHNVVYTHRFKTLNEAINSLISEILAL